MVSVCTALNTNLIPPQSRDESLSSNSKDELIETQQRTEERRKEEIHISIAAAAEHTSSCLYKINSAVQCSAVQYSKECIV